MLPINKRKECSELSNRWYKENKADVVWWKDTDTVGEFIFSFDKKIEFNLFADYPYKLTEKQREIFYKENPHWTEFF